MKKEIDEIHLRQLEDIAAGVEGSDGEVSLSPELAQVLSELGGDLEKCTEIGAGAVMCPCRDLCDIVLGKVQTSSEQTKGKPRKTGTASRSGGAAERIRENRKRSEIEDPSTVSASRRRRTNAEE